MPSFETAKILVREDGSTLGTVGGGCVENDVWKAARQVMLAEKPKRLLFDLTDTSNLEAGLICGGKVEVFVEPILATPTVYVFGAGHVSKFISKVAVLAGFNSVIIDNRPQYANAERFPEATQIFSESFEAAFEAIHPNEFSYIVIVTRGHQEDQTVLGWAAGTRARYIGMIGSKVKKRTLFQNLREEGIPQEALDRVQSPMGVEINAILPEEIAVSVVAQMIAYRRSRPGSRSSRAPARAVVAATAG